MSKGKSNWSKIAFHLRAFQYIYTHVYCAHMYEYIYTYMPRFSASGFFGPPSVSSRPLDSHLITTRVTCVCVFVYTHTCTHMHSHPVKKRCTASLHHTETLRKCYHTISFQNYLKILLSRDLIRKHQSNTLISKKGSFKLLSKRKLWLYSQHKRGLVWRCICIA